MGSRVSSPIMDRYRVVFIFQIFAIFSYSLALNNRPIIGIVSQEISYALDDLLPPGHNYTSHIAASYVKWLEAAGARVVPIIVNPEETTEEDVEYFQQIFSGISGLLIPGGWASIHDSGYSRASNILYDLAIQENRNGEYFPIWGTCLGFEMMALMAAQGQPNLKRCQSYDQAVPLKMTEEITDSVLFQSAPVDVIDQLSTLNVTSNFHHWCLTPENFTKYHMEDFWRLLSVNDDKEGLEFISTLEARDFPFFATQFHPEKNSFEWAVKYKEIPHSREAVNVGLYFAQFFVDQARQSNHSFASRTEEEEHLIYNYQSFYSGMEGRNYGFQQVYLF